MNRKPLPGQANLLYQVSCGDEYAFKRLYEHYSSSIYRVAHRYLHSADAAEDIVQEIFLAIWNKRADLAKILAFEHYLLVMTRNLCLKHIKDLAKESAAHVAFSTSANDAESEGNENYHAMLENVIGQLPAQQKRVIELAKIQGMSHEKIAGLLNLSASTVNNHITAAVKSIKLRLQQYAIFVLCLFETLFQ